jgi:hypothetical protein
MKAQSILWMGFMLVGMALAAAANETEAGIRTDRLSARHLKVWKAIENIVKAQDEEARPLHSKLYSLWQKVATGRHEVHIEILTPMHLLSYAAGRYEIEKCDPDGQKCTAVIRLNLAVIDKAALTTDGRLTHEFVPFKGLGKEERYAEVLGHELQHAVCALEDPHYASTFIEMDRQGRELTHLLRQLGKLSEQEKRQRIESLRSLTNAIERPAELAEAEIWQELRESQPARIGAMR